MTKGGFWNVMGQDLDALRMLIDLGLLDASTDAADDRKAAAEQNASSIAAVEEKLARYGFPASRVEGSPFPMLV